MCKLFNQICFLGYDLFTFSYQIDKISHFDGQRLGVKQIRGYQRRSKALLAKKLSIGAKLRVSI